MHGLEIIQNPIKVNYWTFSFNNWYDFCACLYFKSSQRVVSHLKQKCVVYYPHFFNVIFLNSVFNNNFNYKIFVAAVAMKAYVFLIMRHYIRRFDCPSRCWSHAWRIIDVHTERVCNFSVSICWWWGDFKFKTMIFLHKNGQN